MHTTGVTLKKSDSIYHCHMITQTRFELFVCVEQMLKNALPFNQLMEIEEVEKIDAKFVLKHLDDLKQNEPIRNLLIAVPFFFPNFLQFKYSFPSQLSKSDFITKDGATEFAKYFANHNIRSLTAEGEYDRRSGEIRCSNLSKVRKAGVVEIIQAFANVDVENLSVVCCIFETCRIEVTKYKIIKKKRQKLHTATLM